MARHLLAILARERPYGSPLFAQQPIHARTILAVIIACAMAEERVAKLRRLDAFRRRVPTVSASALEAICTDIEQHGLPGIFDINSTTDAKNSENDAKNSNKSIEDIDAKNSSTVKHVSQRPLHGHSGNPVGSSTMVNSVAKNSINSDTKNNFDAKNPKNRPDLDEQMKLLLSTDSIIRVSSLIAKSKPHIHERCTKADGLSISDAYKISYSHESAPNEVWMYKRKDIKYDIQKSWISLESPFSGGKIDIELSNDDDNVAINTSSNDA